MDGEMNRWIEVMGTVIVIDISIGNGIIQSQC